MISSGAARARSLAHDVIDRCRAFAEVGVVLEARTTEVHAPQRKQSGDVVSTVVSKVVKRPNKNTYGFLAIKGRPHWAGILVRTRLPRTPSSAILGSLAYAGRKGCLHE